ncbi:MAG: hypothetical protein ACK4M6_04840 [Hyphomonas sp.]
MRLFISLVIAFSLVVAASCSKTEIRWDAQRFASVDANLSAEVTKGVWRATAPYTITLDGLGRYEICILERGEKAQCDSGAVEYRSNYIVILLGFLDTEVGGRLLQNSGELERARESIRFDNSNATVPDGAYDFTPNVLDDDIAHGCRRAPCHHFGSNKGHRYLFKLKER